MKLTIIQIHELSAIIQRNHALVISGGAGIDTLTESDQIIFKKYGIDLNQLYLESTNTTFSSFHFGLICDSLKELESTYKLTYSNLLEYVSKGKYIPLSKKEITIINHIRTQSLSHLESVGSKIFQDVNKILPDSSRASQEAFLREEVEKGYVDRKTTKQISSEIAHKTGDWSRDFDQIINNMMSIPIEDQKIDETQKASKPRPKIRAIIDGKEVWI